MMLHRMRGWSSWTVWLLLMMSAPDVVSAAQDEATPVVDESPESVFTDEGVTPVVPTSLQSAADYCLMQEGVVVERFPFLGTNTAVPIRLSGSDWFCELTGSPEAEPPTSRISILLSTMYTTEPTLATMAYLAQVPVGQFDQSEGLATAYCDYLGGSSKFGLDEDLAGGWASNLDSPETTSIGICIFPDGSAIDDWGLTYNADGIIRGADLSKLIRYQDQDEFEIAFPSD